MPPRPLPTIHQVAKRAGVSTATVSRVLTQPAVVAPATRQRVQRAVDLDRLHAELGGRRTTCGRCARASCSSPVPDISNPFFSQILQGIEDAALRAGYAVLVGDTQHDEQREEGYARMLKRREAGSG